MSVLPDATVEFMLHDNIGTIGQAGMAKYRDYFKFSFVRNPWERVLSWYSLAYKYRWDKHSPFISFDDFIGDYERARRGLKIDGSFMFNQLDYLSDGGGEPMVDAVGRYENYEDDLARILSRCDVPFERIPKINTTRHGTVGEAYSEEGRALVETLCAKDIEYWGYRFD